MPNSDVDSIRFRSSGVTELAPDRDLAAAGFWRRRLRLASTTLLPVAAPAVFLLWGLFIGLSTLEISSPVTADSTADWLVASAVRDGLDPYQDLRRLAQVYDIGYLSPAWDKVGISPWVHPRTPAALLALLPTTLVDPERLYEIVVFGSVVLLGVIGATILAPLRKGRWYSGVSLAALFVFSAPFIRSLQFGSSDVLLAGLVGMTWLGVRHGDRRWAGIPLGLAIAFRLFPGLVLIPLVFYRRWRAATSAVVTSVALTGIALWLLAIEPGQVLEGIISAGAIWLGVSGNGSLVASLHLLTGADPFLVVGILGFVASVGIWSMRDRGVGIDQAMATAVVAMLLLSPLAWDHYDVILALVVSVLLARDNPLVMRLTGGVWLFAMTIGFWVWRATSEAWQFPGGLPALAGRLLLLVALVVFARSAKLSFRPLRELGTG